MAEKKTYCKQHACFDDCASKMSGKDKVTKALPTHVTTVTGTSRVRTSPETRGVGGLVALETGRRGMDGTPMMGHGDASSKISEGHKMGASGRAKPVGSTKIKEQVGKAMTKTEKERRIKDTAGGALGGGALGGVLAGSKGAAYGAGLGAVSGAMPKKKDQSMKYSVGRNAAIGGLAGGLLGGGRMMPVGAGIGALAGAASHPIKGEAKKKTPVKKSDDPFEVSKADDKPRKRDAAGLLGGTLAGSTSAAFGGHRLAEAATGRNTLGRGPMFLSGKGRAKVAAQGAGLVGAGVGGAYATGKHYDKKFEKKGKMTSVAKAHDAKVKGRSNVAAAGKGDKLTAEYPPEVRAYIAEHGGQVSKSDGQPSHLAFLNA